MKTTFLVIVQKIKFANFVLLFSGCALCAILYFCYDGKFKFTDTIHFKFLCFALFVFVVTSVIL